MKMMKDRASEQSHRSDPSALPVAWFISHVAWAALTIERSLGGSHPKFNLVGGWNPQKRQRMGDHSKDDDIQISQQSEVYSQPNKASHHSLTYCRTHVLLHAFVDGLLPATWDMPGASTWPIPACTPCAQLKRKGPWSWNPAMHGSIDVNSLVCESVIDFLGYHPW